MVYESYHISIPSFIAFQTLYFPPYKRLQNLGVIFYIISTILVYESYHINIPSFIALQTLYFPPYKRLQNLGVIFYIISTILVYESYHISVPSFIALQTVRFPPHKRLQNLGLWRGWDNRMGAAVFRQRRSGQRVFLTCLRHRSFGNRKRPCACPVLGCRLHR